MGPKSKGLKPLCYLLDSPLREIALHGGNYVYNGSYGDSGTPFERMMGWRFESPPRGVISLKKHPEKGIYGKILNPASKRYPGDNKLL